VKISTRRLAADVMSNSVKGYNFYVVE
jgi:hypothetical protein